MSKANENLSSVSGDLFSPIVEIFVHAITLAITSFTNLLAGGLVFEGRENKMRKYQTFSVEMLDDRTKTNKESDLGWSISYGLSYPLEFLKTHLHTFIIGASGWGKSNLINILMLYCLRRDQGIIFIDPKGSRESITNFKNLCRNKRKTYHIFSEFDHEAKCFNPLKNQNPTQATITLMRSFDWGDRPNQFYLNKSSEALLNIFIKLEKFKITPSIPLVYRMLKLYYKDAEEVSGLLTQLQLLVYSPFGRLLEDKCNSAMNLRKARDTGACLYIGVSSQGYGYVARTLAKMFVSEAMNLSHSIGIEYEDSHDAIKKSVGLFIDEAGSILFPDFIDLANKARSSGINLYLAVQSYSDMKMVAKTETLMEQFMECFGNWFIQRQTNPKNAEELANAFGTYSVKKKTEQTDNGQTSGKGSLSEGNAYFISPNIIKAINPGQSILLTHDPVELNLINIRDIRGAKEFKSLPEQKQEEAQKKEEMNNSSRKMGVVNQINIKRK